MALLPTLFGYNFAFWMAMSLLRFITEEISTFAKRHWPRSSVSHVTEHKIQPQEVAVILAARNEEAALPTTLTALKKNLPADNIYVGSDGSSDKTATVARKQGCHVVDLHPNRGKSKVLAYLLQHFNILTRYKAVLIMDAEVIVSDNYLNIILPYFDEPEVVAFVSHAHSRWRQHWLPKWSMFFTAYRLRLWLILYYGLRYGQTWKYTCATPIIPGGSSVYRGSALAQMEIDTPGLIIEDFHMTFQVYHKKLGRIASHPSAYIIDQEPYTLKDYYRQVYRWFLGFWQTVFYHGYWPSFFWFTNFLFTLEMLFYSIVVLTVPFMLMAILFSPFDSFSLFHISLTSLSIERTPVTLTTLLIGFFVIDYAITILAAVIERKPAMALYGPGFFLLRYIDTFIFLWTLPIALVTKNASGIWQSPERRMEI